MISLDRLLDPKKIAIAGLSADSNKHGARVLRNLRNLGYPGQIWGVNPGVPDVDGVDMYPSVAALPYPPDMVVAAVPGRAAAEVVAESRGVGVVVLFASGFGESGAPGRNAEERLRRSVAKVGTRLLGPNSGGVIRPDHGLAASFLTCLERPASDIRGGPVAVVTQSGGIGSYLHNLAAARGEGLGVSVSTGNEVDIKLGEAVEAVSRLEEIRVIVAIIETLRDGEKFVEAIISAMARGKRIVACRIGAGAAAGKLMLSHTGAMALPTVLVNGVLEALGVNLADTPQEAYEIAALISRTPPLRGRRLGVITHSGGFAILLSDLAEESGRLDFPEPSPRLTGAISPYLDHGAAANPLDMGGIIGGPHRFSEVVGAFATSGEYDCLIAVSSAHPPSHTIARVESLLELEAEIPIIHLWLAGDQAAEGRSLLVGGEAAVTDDPRVAIKALTAMASEPDTRPDLGPLTGPPETWGVPGLIGVVAENTDEAVAAARSLGYPVVVKADVSGLDHKTDIGAVLVDLRDDREVAAAHRSIVHRLAVGGWSAGPTRVQPFRPGIEMILGGIDHDSFGPVVLVGFGGVLSEATADVVYAPAPVDEVGALRMIDRLRGRRILDGPRNTSRPDLDRLTEIISLVSRGVLARSVREFEINPLIWDGSEWLAADWLVITRAESS